MKRFNTITIVLALLLAPSLLFGAASSFAPAKAVVGESNTVTVPLVVGNNDGLMAMDIPLTFSEGVTLTEVKFDETRVEYFDLKLANIDNDKNQVIIGLITQVTPNMKPLLESGEGPVAYLVFTINDETLTEFRIDELIMENPHHRLMYVYSDVPGEQRTDYPEFTGVTVALSGGGESALPSDYALEQNYPNPFNPTTEISFALPQASRVTLEIYNVLGQQVTSLIDGDMPAGNHTVTWNGTNSGGGAVASGIYFYRLAADTFVKTKKMMMLK